VSIESRLSKLETLRTQTGYDPARDGPMTIILREGDPDPVLRPGCRPRIILDFRGRETADIPGVTHLRFPPEDADA
jgi:hypothetical protein